MRDAPQVHILVQQKPHIVVATIDPSGKVPFFHSTNKKKNATNPNINETLIIYEDYDGEE